LSEKWRFRRFIRQNVRETACFLLFSSISGGFEGLFGFVIPSTTTPGLGTPPANSWRTKQFWIHPRSL
jgi:hypothetical protein